MMFVTNQTSWVSSLFKNTQKHAEKTLTTGQQKALELTGTTGVEGDNDSTLSEIKNKLQNGLELSPSELEYLRANAPDLYKEAMRMVSLRKQIQQRLEQCKSKEEVSQAKTEINSQIASECDVSGTKKCDLNQSLMYQHRINTANRCFVKFCKTDNFRNLPDSNAEYTRLKVESRKENLREIKEISNSDNEEFSDDKNLIEEVSDEKKLSAADNKEKRKSENKNSDFSIYSKNYTKAENLSASDFCIKI